MLKITTVYLIFLQKNKKCKTGNLMEFLAQVWYFLLLYVKQNYKILFYMKMKKAEYNYYPNNNYNLKIKIYVKL